MQYKQVLHQNVTYVCCQWNLGLLASAFHIVFVSFMISFYMEIITLKARAVCFQQSKWGE